MSVHKQQKKMEAKQDPERGLTSHFDRRNKFYLRRFKNNFGLEVYQLENRGVSAKIFIERSHFDKFRAALYKISLADDPLPTDIKLKFKEKIRYIIRIQRGASGHLTVEEVEHGPQSSGQLHLATRALPHLLKILYADELRHPNDTLDLLTQYHRIFQFTFVEGSESITSDLQLRRDVLSQVDLYRPKTSTGRPGMKGAASAASVKPKATGKKSEAFKPRLGEKDHDHKLKVNYEALFDEKAELSPKVPKAADHEAGQGLTGATKTTFPLPLMASEVKSFQKSSYSCQFAQEEIQEFRELFLQDRSSEFFLGFEIVDAIFKRPSGLRTFRFPLYYMRVSLEESGRELYIHPEKEGRFYLNHLALANLVESFAPFVAGTGGPIVQFFETLLAQTIKITDRDDRVRLSRMLPVDETVFHRTRELLLGYEGENGRGGLLGHLKIVGIEADLEAVYLYKAAKNDAPLVAALSADLEVIRRHAHESPTRFYNSLLGQFLTPEMRQAQIRGFGETLAMPGAQPKAIRSLVEKLNNHDLVLLEGPPGTGKTFTIMNLFIHALITGKRMLVVSDKEAAVHALTEKLVEYLLGRDRQSSNAQHLMALWNCGVKVVDKAPLADSTMSTWVRDLQDMLKVQDPKIVEWAFKDPQVMRDLRRIGDRIDQFKQHIEQHMAARLGPTALFRKRVAPKRMHATTVNDIDELTAFLRFASDQDRHEAGWEHLGRFIKDREYLLAKGFGPCYGFFQIGQDLAVHQQLLAETLQAMERLLQAKPKSLARFEAVAGHKVGDHPLFSHLHQLFMNRFPPHASGLSRGWHFFTALFRNEPLRLARQVYGILKRQYRMVKALYDEPVGVANQLRSLHRSLGLPPDQPVPLCLEICRFALDTMMAGTKPSTGRLNPSVQESLQEIERLMAMRDKVVNRAFLGRLGEIGQNAYTSTEPGATSRATSIGALLDNLKTFSSLEAGSEVLLELQEKFVESFPIWICRKQAVSFLFPCKENLFDLVIVDEATQCRVDDALPILYRARKVMVVGDEKQTVLAKDSSIDDYLFKEHDLNEHLISSQAMAIKGGGSHIFGLVKGIKQASVMLDEHYRCPPEIIQFSNHYVYHDELKTMQWRMEGRAPAVVVDHSESQTTGGGRQGSGKYKGIETDMVDRFLDFVRKKVSQIEKETGEKIHTDTDIALCYFLLKNEPYIKDVKGAFLHALGRGQDILDGAGAALQGKERDYIFYLWDINRGNIGAFRQGDDPDKRKGELNVLMSRPKVRAYHYLHKDFPQLDHRSATIVDYLWSTYLRQNEKAQKAHFTPRTQQPKSDFIPWRRSSGPLMEKILLGALKEGESKELVQRLSELYRVQTSVVVGDPFHKVDLVFAPKKADSGSEKAIGIIDLADFNSQMNSSQDIVDYYFQCLRAKPAIQPFFLFLHELATPRSRSFRSLKKALLHQEKVAKPPKAS